MRSCDMVPDQLDGYAVATHEVSDMSIDDTGGGGGGIVARVQVRKGAVAPAACWGNMRPLLWRCMRWQHAECL